MNDYISHDLKTFNNIHEYKEYIHDMELNNISYYKIKYNDYNIIITFKTAYINKLSILYNYIMKVLNISDFLLENITLEQFHRLLYFKDNNKYYYLYLTEYIYDELILTKHNTLIDNPFNYSIQNDDINLVKFGSNINEQKESINYMYNNIVDVNDPFGINIDFNTSLDMIKEVKLEYAINIINKEMTENVLERCSDIFNRL